MASKRKRRAPGAATHAELLELFGELVAALHRELAEKRATPTLMLVIRDLLRDCGVSAEVGTRAKAAAALAMLGESAKAMALPFATKSIGLTDEELRGGKKRGR
jgi:hypothetical protein